MNFIDLFSGAGGMSEGFIRAGFTPIAHVEIDKAACNTLLTRTVYHHLKDTPDFEKYISYIKGEGISRNELYNLLPDEKRDSVINLPISDETNQDIFQKIDLLKGNQTIDLIIGGPPCQAYSLVGRSRDKNRMKGDPRNNLFKQYAKYLEYYQPAYFVFENVIGLLSAKTQEGESYLKMMIDLFHKVGYTTEYKVQEAKDFGVLQNRKRIILIGKKGTEKGFYPEFEKWNPGVMVSEVLDDLQPLQAGEGTFFTSEYKEYQGDYLFKSHIRNGLDFTTQHISRPHTDQDKEIYRIAVNKWNRGKRLEYNELAEELKTHKNTKSFIDRFKVVASDKPFSQTVVAHIAKDGHYYIHPDITQNRSLTPREAARLQSFPDDYYFEGENSRPGRTSAFKQIGNAVPPLMAEQIAGKIKMFL
ncbi:MAG: DNA cytosine methyltransferase [Bacteroidales bacterium]|nr:DNA cytosine methyltransferase [Bacteroidales bacterium]